MEEGAVKVAEAVEEREGSREALGMGLLVALAEAVSASTVAVALTLRVAVPVGEGVASAEVVGCWVWRPLGAAEVVG